MLVVLVPAGRLVDDHASISMPTSSSSMSEIQEGGCSSPWWSLRSWRAPWEWSYTRTLDTNLGELAGEQAEHQRVTPAALEGHVRSEESS